MESKCRKENIRERMKMGVEKKKQEKQNER